MKCMGVYRPGETEKEEEFYLILKEEPTRFAVCAVNPQGHTFSRGYILSIDKTSKKLQLHTGVNKEFGFRLTIEGAIETEVA